MRWLWDVWVCQLVWFAWMAGFVLAAGAVTLVPGQTLVEDATAVTLALVGWLGSFVVAWRVWRRRRSG